MRISDCGFIMNAESMKKRTQDFAFRIIKLVESLPQAQTASIIRKQLLRCGTSVGANYRAACRAKSRADFIAKLGIVEEEADEVIYWVELLIKAELVKETRVEKLLDEAKQILAMVISSINTTRGGTRKENEK
jgi:four helix bundle protein